MTERSRRAGASKANNAKSSVAELVALRKSGKKRADAFELKSEEDVYDMVEEKDYAKLVAKRREEGGGFIVDDEGLGYADIGEEEDWAAEEAKEEDSPEDNGPCKGGKGGKRKGDGAAAGGAEAPKAKKDKRADAQAELAAAAKGAKRLHGMFAAAARAGPTKSAAPKPVTKDSAAADALLEDILGDIAPDESERQRHHAAPAAASSYRPAPVVAAAAAAAFPAPVGGGSSASSAHPVFSRGSLRSAPSPKARAHQRSPSPPPLVEAEEEDAFMMDDDDESDGKTVPADKQQPQQEKLQPAGAAAAKAGDKRRVSFSNLPPLSPAKAAATGAAQAAAQAAADVEKPTPAPPQAKAVVPDPPAGGSVVGWQSVCADEEGASVPATPSSPPLEAGAALQAALDQDGNLPFYFLDAVEESSAPGKVFLFGKVSTGGGSFQSCCAVVGDLYRDVYAVPKANVFDDSDGALAALEAKVVAKEEGAKRNLLVALQGRCVELKDELRNLLLDRNIADFSMVPVKRSYGFEREDVARSEQWVIKLRVPATSPPLPSDLSGRQYTCLFGTNTSPLEALLLKRKVMGPSWLLLNKPGGVSCQLSWCKTECTVSGHKAVSTPTSQPPPPPLVVAALNLKTVVNHRQKVNEIAAASVLWCREVKADGPMAQPEWNTAAQMRHFTVVRRLDGCSFPLGWESQCKEENAKPVAKRNNGLVLSSQESERGLLNFLLARLQQIDADVLVGHNIGGFDLDVLLHRLKACKVAHWSRVGRLRRNKMPNLASGGGNKFGGGAAASAMSALAGRLLCDTYLSAREFVKEVSYTLSSLASNQLKMQRRDFDATNVPAMYGSASSLLGLVKHAEEDAWLSLALMFHLSVLPLTRQLTCLSGSLWAKTLQGARAQRIEYLLLHEFHRLKYLLPDKLSYREKERLAKKAGGGDVTEEDNENGMEGGKGAKGKGPQYAGGLVLEPKKGLYDKMVLLLDFNSLYPSIIQEYNICFTTVSRPKDDAVPPLPENVGEQAVLPGVLRKLVQRRRQVKELLKQERDVLKRQQLDIRQQALKLTANSMYGCLGFAHSRFYAKPLAQLVTSQGREILQSTADLVENSLGLEVIYGDTDSIMINSNLNDVSKAKMLGALVKKEVNKRYKLLELELDYIFKTILLLKKKKYAALKIENITEAGQYTTTMECKGLDIVRRDWCPLSKELGQACLDAILSGRSSEEVVETIHETLRAARDALDNGAMAVEKLVITKQLTKSPEEYPDAANQAHVQVAMRRAAQGKREGVAAGETVPYVICRSAADGGEGKATGKGLAARAYHPEEVGGDVVPDLEYYLAQQVHPVVSRLCAPMEGTSASQLADCLGLDATKFRAQTAADSASAREDALLGGGCSLDDDDRYKLCDALTLQCPTCAHKFPFQGVASLLKPSPAAAGAPPPSPLACPQCPAAALSAEPTEADAEVSMVTPVKSLAAAPSATASPGVLSAAMLSNQVKLRANEAISTYYDGWLRCDEACGCQSRCVCTRTTGDAAPGTLSAQFPQCTGRVSRQYTESDLYKQLSHLVRQLDVGAALAKLNAAERDAAAAGVLPWAPALEQARATAARVRDSAAYKWVRLDQLCA